MPKYNIAWVPSNDKGQFENFSAKISQQIRYEKYLLGDHSIPHVSICHFECDEHAVEEIWAKVKGLDLHKIDLTFGCIRSKSYPGHPKWGGVCWVSLMPDKLDQLIKVHLMIAQIIKVPLNAAFSDYDPHLTLLNSCDERKCNSLNETPQLKDKLTDDFSIALGEMDEEGQLLHIVYGTTKTLFS